MNKSYIGQSLCFFCRETVSILLDKRLQDTIPEKVDQGKVCQNCQNALDQGGIFFIEIKDGEEHVQNPYRTGNIWAITREAFDRICADDSEEIRDQIIKKQATYISESVAKEMGFHNLEQ